MFAENCCGVFMKFLRENRCLVSCRFALEEMWNYFYSCIWINSRGEIYIKRKKDRTMNDDGSSTISLVYTKIMSLLFLCRNSMRQVTATMKLFSAADLEIDEANKHKIFLAAHLFKNYFHRTRWGPWALSPSRTRSNILAYIISQCTKRTTPNKSHVYVFPPPRLWGN